MDHSEHYPTMIEHPRTKKRVAVRSPLEHHKQLLAWKLPGLDPVPAEPVDEAAEEVQGEPGYPTMIENEKTGERVAVYSKADHDAKLAFWAAKYPKSTTRQPAAPPPPPPPPANPRTGTARSTATASNKGRGTTKGELQPPTKEDFMKQNYPASIAQRMADEEVRKFNAGKPPYDGK